MKKIIKLTESDLNRIIKRVINESSMGRYKLPEGITMELINQYLNEEDPEVLSRICNFSFYDHNFIKKLIKDFYIYGKPLKEMVKEYYDLAKNGELFPNEQTPNKRWEYQTETRILYLRKLFLERLKKWSLIDWSLMPNEEEGKTLYKKYEISQLKQSLYKLLDSYKNKFTTDELNDIFIDVRLNKNPGYEKFSNLQLQAINKYRETLNPIT
jgi:hypothetical protein